MSPADAHQNPGRNRAREAPERYRLRLYVAGATPVSANAVEAIEEMCRERLAGRYELEVVDIYQAPAQAREDDIIATPTLVKSQPGPGVRVVGDLADRERVLAVLSLVDP
ncbi:MAG: circadian clock KaiB family protein [Solirubrobacteraceae bacterium]